ncbi:hypothetical protein niasHS_013816 [Heterodera schachtii]|uniref:Uncharacterized protein n=1 Tax=Heterodera schachtii TaxID=97005 RepID=A0ABD2IJ31_HETSC
MSQCTTATITTPNSSAFVTSSALNIVDRMPKNDKNGDRMPKGDKNGDRMPKRDKAESSRAPKNATVENRTPKNETIENRAPKNEPNLEVVPGNKLTGSNRMPKVYYHNRIKRAASNGPNGMPNEKVPFADLDKMPNCSSEYQHHVTVSSEFSVSMASPMPSLAPSSSSSSSVVASSDSFSTIRRNCERHMRRLERYKKARSFCSLDTAEAEEEEDNKMGNNTKPTPMAEGGNDQHKADDQQHQEEQILRQIADKKTGTGGEQFETLRSKMLSLMENDMHLLAKLLQLGETLCELRSKHEQQQQQQQQQQQNPMKYCDGYGGGGGQTASISSTNWAQQTAAERDDSDGDVHDDDEDEQRQQQQKQKKASLDDEEADVIGDASAPRSLLHRARQHRRRAPLPPEFGRASAATVTRVYLAGEQHTNDANRRPGVPLGCAVRSDQEDNDEEREEEDDDHISPNVQYFSRKNSVLRIPIPPRASNRNFGRPKFHQRLNSSNFSSSSPSCCAGAAAGSSPLVMMAAHTKMLSSAAPSPSAHCAAAASAAHHHHNGTAPPPPPPPSTIVETDLLMMDSGHSSASSEADPQQHSPPGAPSSRFSTFSSSLSTGSASCRSLFGVAALAEAAKRTKSEERRADGSRGGSAAERCAGVAETERAVLDGWKTNCNVKNNKSSFSD